VFLVNDTSEWWSLEQRSAVYHRTAAAKARRLREEATTRRLKEQLEDVIARHEQIAEEIERAFEPDGDAVSSQDETSALSSETPADNPGAPPDPHLGQPGAPV
jgi:aspartate aminotransferase-like enzyme